MTTSDIYPPDDVPTEVVGALEAGDDRQFSEPNHDGAHRRRARHRGECGAVATARAAEAREGS